MERDLLFGFDRELIMEHCKKLKSTDEQIKYLRLVLKEYKSNPPDLDPNYGIRPGLIKLLNVEIEYSTRLMEEEKKNNENSMKKPKSRIRDNVSNEVIAEEVIKLWDNGIENLEMVFDSLSSKSNEIFGTELSAGQIKGRYQRQCKKNKDFKREKYN